MVRSPSSSLFFPLPPSSSLFLPLLPPSSLFFPRLPPLRPSSSLFFPSHLKDDKEEIEQVHAVPRTDTTLALPQREADLPHKEEAEEAE